MSARARIALDGGSSERVNRFSMKNSYFAYRIIVKHYDITSTM
jgi:hypothetical protein